MEVVKKTSEYTIYQKRSKRYAVRNAENKWLNGPDKVKILVEEKLLKVPIPQPKQEAAPEEEAAPAEEGTEEEAAPEEEAPAEE